MIMDNELEFIEAVATSISIAEVIRKIGRSAVGSNYTYVKKHATRLSLDTSHWKGQRHGTTSALRALPLETVFVENSRQSTSTVKKIILRNGLMVYKCAKCNLVDTWNERPLVLRLDHINGNNADHRLSNLRFLCPNCDSQTSTYCGKNKQKRTNSPKPRCRPPSREDLGMHTITKINWPSADYIRKQLETRSFKSLSKELGVSDMAIRKYLARHL